MPSRAALLCAVGVVAVAATIAWTAFAPLAPPPGAVEPPGDVAPLAAARLRGVRSTIAAADASVITVSAREVEAPPVQVFGPIRLGFLRSGIASDVHIEFDGRDPHNTAA